MAGQNLAADDAAIACARVDALADAAKRAGAKAKIDMLRATIFLGLLDGRFHHMPETTIITDLLRQFPKPPKQIEQPEPSEQPEQAIEPAPVAEQVIEPTPEPAPGPASPIPEPEPEPAAAGRPRGTSAEEAQTAWGPLDVPTCRGSRLEPVTPPPAARTWRDRFDDPDPP